MFKFQIYNHNKFESFDDRVYYGDKVYYEYHFITNLITYKWSKEYKWWQYFKNNKYNFTNV